jgi:Zn-dependent peptidase ImmA (M78 family)/transcriptional regulator with XRE-family HTH domain
MAATERIPLGPGVLDWARRTAGYDKSTAAKRLNVRIERLEKWESGNQYPTISQLRQMAKLYRRPLAVLLLPSPPKDFDALRDFRRLGDVATVEWSPALHSEFKRALTQREVLLELAELAPATLPDSHLDLRLSIDVPDEQAGAQLRAMLHLDAWPSSIRSNQNLALRAAIEAVEQLGILVLQTRDVAIEEMRGFSISEWPYPVVVLNGSDWPRPRLFTLLHELCHIALNAGGLCDLHDVQGRSGQTSEDSLEHYCNRVAAAALMPGARVLEMANSVEFRGQWSRDNLSELSGRFGSSAEAMLLRLVSLNLATWDDYWRVKPELQSAYADARKDEKERQKSSPGGPTYYVVKARNLGHGYVQSVMEAFQSRAISSYDVVDYLDVRFDQLAKLQAAVRR